MLKANEIKAAVGELLNMEYPGEAIFTKLLPKDFSRPSHYVEMAGKSGTAENISMTEVTANVRVTAFPPADAYGDSDDEAVDLAGDELLELFTGQILKAGDRALTVEKVDVEYGADFAAAVLTLNYMDYTPRRKSADGALMEHLHVNGKKIC